MAAVFLAPLLTELAKNGLGMLAGAIQAKGKEVIEQKLGVKIPETPNQLTPELLQQLQIKQMEHEEFLVNSQLEGKKLDLEGFKTEVADTQNARDREIKLLQAGYVNSRANFMLAAAGVVVIAIMFLVVYLSDMGDFEKSILTLILGRALGYVDQGFNYEFGSTRASKQKDETIKKLGE